MQKSKYVRTCAQCGDEYDTNPKKDFRQFHGDLRFTDTLCVDCANGIEPDRELVASVTPENLRDKLRWMHRHRDDYQFPLDYRRTAVTLRLLVQRANVEPALHAAFETALNDSTFIYSVGRDHEHDQKART